MEAVSAVNTMTYRPGTSIVLRVPMYCRSRKSKVIEYVNDWREGISLYVHFK